MNVQIADYVNRFAFETFPKVDTTNKATRLWEDYFPVTVEGNKSVTVE